MSEPYWEPLAASLVSSGLVKLYDLILPAAAANFDITSLTQEYAHLRLIAQLRGDNASLNVGAYLRFNNDSGANYNGQRLAAGAATVTAAEALAGTGAHIGYCAAGSAGAGRAAIFGVDIPNYSQAVFHKQLVSLNNRNDSDTTAQTDIEHFISNWKNTAAINRITLYPNSGNFAVGSRCTLYGLDTRSVASPASALISVVTSLPASPYDGQEVILTDSLTAPTYSWRLIYLAAITDAYKWLCIGGDAKSVRVETDYPTNPALSLSVPRPGIYNLDHGATWYLLDTTSTVYSTDLVVDGAGSYAYYLTRGTANTSGFMGASAGHQPGVVVASTILQRTGINTGTIGRIERRWIKAMPVRLS